MKALDIFLEALEKTYKEKGIMFIPRWISVKDDKFPAHTKFILKVNELTENIITQKFTVQRVENLSINPYMPKDKIEEGIKEDMVQQVIEIMLKYYINGNTV